MSVADATRRLRRNSGRPPARWSGALRWLSIRKWPRGRQAGRGFPAAASAPERPRRLTPGGAPPNCPVGQRVAPGTPLMSVVSLDRVWVDANSGKPVGGHPHRPACQTVRRCTARMSCSTAVEAWGGTQGALLPAQNATGNWIQIVQRVPVRVSLDPKGSLRHRRAWPVHDGDGGRTTVSGPAPQAPRRPLRRPRRQSTPGATGQGVAQRIIAANAATADSPARAGRRHGPSERRVRAPACMHRSAGLSGWCRRAGSSVRSSPLSPGNTPMSKTP